MTVRIWCKNKHAQRSIKNRRLTETCTEQNAVFIILFLLLLSSYVIFVGCQFKILFQFVVHAHKHKLKRNTSNIFSFASYWSQIEPENCTSVVVCVYVVGSTVHIYTVLYTHRRNIIHILPKDQQLLKSREKKIETNNKIKSTRQKSRQQKRKKRARIWMAESWILDVFGDTFYVQHNFPLNKYAVISNTYALCIARCMQLIHSRFRHDALLISTGWMLRMVILTQTHWNTHFIHYGLTMGKRNS